MWREKEVDYPPRIPPLPFITVTKILSKINLGTGIGEVVGTDPDRVSEEGVREHDGGG